MSHMRMVLSADAVTKYELSWATANAWMVCWWPIKLKTTLPEAMFQTLAVVSELPYKAKNQVFGLAYQCPKKCRVRDLSPKYPSFTKYL